MKRLWILGASDPEMTAIETLLTTHGEQFVYGSVADATPRGIRRSHAGEAYQCTEIAAGTALLRQDHDGIRLSLRPTHVVCVECDLAQHASIAQHADRCDHHRPGDRGFGAPPSDYWGASSIGQVCAILGVDPTEELRMVAAADHCLAAAYRGECPGVDPDALMRWRVTSRAAFQGRPEAEVLADLESTLAALRESPSIALSYGVHVRDMRTPDREPWPELPEAQCRSGIPYLSGPFVQPDGRSKITCCGPAEVVRAFLEEWAPAHGVAGTYGDPARGFAGGYVCRT